MSLDNKKSLKKIKSSILQRSLKLTKMTLSAGGKIIGHNLQTAFSDESSKDLKWREMLTKQAQILSKDLGELKGSLMKAGQLISMYGELFLPEEANEFLKKLQSQSPPVEFAEIEKILRQEYLEKRDLLKIDPSPIGAASLGQVHRAELKESNSRFTMALKVQYPGIKHAIKSDLKSLKSILSLLHLLPSEFQTKVLFEEVEEMLNQELDYGLELEHTNKYKQLLRGDPRYLVPEVFPEWSRKNILASSFESGIAIDDPLIKNLSPLRRNRLAENFLDLYFKELFEWSFIQTDPHFGNYKIRLDEQGKDKIVLLDFGAVRKYNDEFIIPYRKMVKAAFLKDIQALEEASLELRFLSHEDPQSLRDYFVEFCLLTMEPFSKPVPDNQHLFDQNGHYDWKASDLPKRLTRIGLKIIKEFPLRTPPKELIFIDRKTGGVFVMMSHLGAKIDGGKLLEKYLSPPK